MTVVNNIIQGSHVNQAVIRRGNNWRPRTRLIRGGRRAGSYRDDVNARFNWLHAELRRQTAAMNRYRNDAQILRTQLRRTNQAARARNANGGQNQANNRANGTNTRDDTVRQR